MAGPWETDDPIAGKPAQIGILLKIEALRQVPFDQRKVIGEGPQQISAMDIRVYQRIGGEYKGGWLSTSGRLSNVSWDGQHLQLTARFGPGGFVQGELDLDFDLG